MHGCSERLTGEDRGEEWKVGRNNRYRHFQCLDMTKSRHRKVASSGDLFCFAFRIKILWHVCMLMDGWYGDKWKNRGLEYIG